jgi:uncharacterized OsmC-like protein
MPAGGDVNARKYQHLLMPSPLPTREWAFFMHLPGSATINQNLKRTIMPTNGTTAVTRTINGVPVDHCLGLVNAVQNDPQKGQTVWSAATTWKGGFECESHIRNHVVQMNEPEQLGGTDTAPNMVEVVLAAYSSCLTVGYALNAAVRGIEVRSLKIDVEGDLDLAGFFGISADVPAGFSKIRTTVHLDADATREDLEALHDHVLKTSPVGSILQRPLDVTTVLV